MAEKGHVFRGVAPWGGGPKYVPFTTFSGLSDVSGGGAGGGGGGQGQGALSDLCTFTAFSESMYFGFLGMAPGKGGGRAGRHPPKYVLFPGKEGGGSFYGVFSA